MSTVYELIGLAAAYFLGSVPTGYLAVQARKGVDIRQLGSGNIGASNVGRVLGRKWGIGVLIFDILKGTAAVALGQMFFYDAGGWLSLDLYKILCAVSVVCGHNWTIFLGFKGGKGVATSVGVILGLAPILAVLTLVLWGVLAKLFGYISVASIVAAVGFCVLTFVFQTSLEMKIFAIVMSGVLIYRHRGNIQRLMKGTEVKIGESLKKVEDVR